MAARANLIIDQGTTFEVSINISNEDSSPIDLTNYTAASKVRKHYSSRNSVPFTVTITNASEGLITLSMSSATTSLLTAGRYVYDVEITSSSENIIRVLEGQVTVTPEVTR